MLKKVKKILRLVVIIMLAVLTINLCYDIGTAFANKTPAHSVSEVEEMDRIRAISEEDMKKQSSVPEKKDTKVVRYFSIIGILVIAIVMLIVITKKEEDNK